MVVGDSMVGKTAIVHKLLHGSFAAQYSATLASEGRLYKHRVSIDGQLRTLRIRDTSGTANVEGISQAVRTPPCIADLNPALSYPILFYLMQPYPTLSYPMSTIPYPFLCQALDSLLLAESDPPLP